MRDAEATRSRILAAAIEEFAGHGFAGGRVDRIARGAGSNVRMIYAYFGGKSGLFDAALETALRTLANDVPPDPDDLAGWAGRVFDHHQERPDILRLSMWARLERPSALSEPSDVYSAKVDGVRVASPGALSPVDVLVFIYAIAQAWQLSPTGLTGLEGAHDDPRRIAAHRRAVVAAVEGMLRDV
ncbi:TetR family transcriptional regulator [Microbacterium sp. KSW4-16]|uniref:TetR family transcriptional regulator n=2 Tax=Microbacterium TaxID=33882 RepID=A0ABY4IVG1_9MICO|nr:TetR family transcriptional regulator [Microbacterium aurugineum]MCK8468733.1 TetR family transcriptional regulator [Microbacterium aurugineum]UPL16683.1 TetR family transcriptional regulator [Microbacterium aurugineum]